MAMNLRQLRSFQAVAELGSLSRASDHLHVAQPALSRQIKLLEHELRANLFRRNGRGMVLTEAGTLLLHRTEGLVRQIEQIRDDFLSLEGDPSGQVALGIVPTAGAVLAGRLAERVTRELPGVVLRLVESYGGHLVDWLHRGQIDVAIIYSQVGDLHLRLEPLAADDLVIVGPRGSGLSGLDACAFAELGSKRLVLPSPAHGLRLLLERAALRENVRLEVAVEADSFRALIDMVERRIGYTVLPPSAIWRERGDGRLETAPLTTPRVTRHLALASPMDRPPSLAVSAVIALVKAEAATLEEEGVWSCLPASSP